MAGETIYVDGLDRLARLLRDADADLLEELKAGNRDDAELVAGTARTLVPRRTGLLERTIRAGATRKSGVVRAGTKRVPYAAPIHFGWPRRHIAPQPFLYDALDRRRRELIDLYQKRVQTVVDKVNR